MGADAGSGWGPSILGPFACTLRCNQPTTQVSWKERIVDRAFAGLSASAAHIRSRTVANIDPLRTNQHALGREVRPWLPRSVRAYATRRSRLSSTGCWCLTTAWKHERGRGVCVCWVRPVLLERQKERKGSPRKNLARKLAGKIAVARDFFSPASASGNFQQKNERRIRLGAKGSAAQHAT